MFAGTKRRWHVADIHMGTRRSACWYSISIIPMIREVRFDLTTELLKGDHVMAIPELFPENAEFEELKSYKTPFNTPELRITLLHCWELFKHYHTLLCATDMEKQAFQVCRQLLNLVAGLNILLYRLSVHTGNQCIRFYFDAPYKHYSSGFDQCFILHTIRLYCFIIVPVTRFTIRNLRAEKKDTCGSKCC